MKRKISTILIAAAFLWFVVVCLAFSDRRKNDFESAKLEIVLRKIGHEILLLSGDHTSRVLPIKQVNEHEFKLSFQNEFAFQPDSLVKVINTILDRNHGIKNYIVNVFNCNDHKMIFGYAKLGDEKNDIVPCSGRIQPKNCYQINIKFEKQGILDQEKGYLIAGLPLLLVIGFLTFKKTAALNPKIDPDTKSTAVFKFGNTVFDHKKREIIIAGAVSPLSQKESELLFIFAQTPNAIIERTTLQKRLWEDEGVIVGRSLDMFISKLRKKLEADSTIEIANVHGKGYKLITEVTR